MRNQPPIFWKLWVHPDHFGRSYGTLFVVIQFQALDSLSPNFNSELLLSSIPRLLDNTSWTFQKFLSIKKSGYNSRIVFYYVYYPFQPVPYFGQLDQSDIPMVNPSGTLLNKKNFLTSDVMKKKTEKMEGQNTWLIKKCVKVKKWPLEDLFEGSEYILASWCLKSFLHLLAILFWWHHLTSLMI